ncbi:MAG: hypothetical protein LH650_08820, partial [Chloroflexi bacterium]|nr:hypothetical protein [Chloroflexota bacterium]
AYVVVWGDNRSGAYDIYAARVSQSGSVIDPTGFVISNAVGPQGQPAISYDGTNSLVVWADTRGTSNDIFGARVGPGGGVSDPAGLPVSTAAGSQSEPDVVFDGTNHMVVWTDSRSGGADIYGSRVSPAGGVLNASGIAISAATGSQISPSIAHDGSSHLVVWQDDRNGIDQEAIFGTRVTNAGSVVTPAGTLVGALGTPTNRAFRPVAAAGGGTFFAMWWGTAFGLPDATGTRISPGGAVLDPNGILVGTRLPSAAQSQPAIAFDGTNHLVVWSDYRAGNLDIYGTRVAPSGRVIDPVGFVIANATNDQLDPAVTFGGGQYLVTWTDKRSGSPDIYMTAVSTAGVVATPAGTPVSPAAADGTDSALAWNGSRYLVAWSNDPFGFGPSTLYATRVSGGAVQDPGGIAISPIGGKAWSPAVASNGSDFLVTFRDTRSGDSHVYANRVSNAGAVIAPGEFLVANQSGYQSVPTVAFDGTNYFVVYTRSTGLAGAQDLYGTRITPAGAVLDGVTTGKLISGGASDPQYPQLAFNGVYFVVWSQRAGNDDLMYGARIALNGNVQDPNGILLGNGGQGLFQFPSRYPVVAKGAGDDWSVVYDRNFAGIYFRGVSPK